MKYGKIYTLITTVIIAPLWVGLVTEFFKERPLLHIIAIIISTLILLFAAILAAHDFIQMIDASYRYQCRKMDRFVSKARKKLAKIIARTNDASVMDYALVKLGEICPPEIYAGILAELIEKERNPGRKQTLLFYSEQIGGNK